MNQSMNEAQREWSWRDAGNHGPLIQMFNMASAITGYSRKPFVPEQLMEKATRRVGLDDFGDKAFREGLDILCRAYSSDKQMTGLGQVAGREMIAGSLAKRLQVVDWYKTHPDVEKEIIDKPWVISGLVRSGTTLGSMLMNLDPHSRSPLVWECDFPIPPAMIATQHSDERIANSQRQLDRFHTLVPPMKVLHPLEACYPHECVVMTMLDIQSILFQAISLAPEYMEWYTDSDKSAAYRTHKQQLQIWQSTIPTIHWALKAPNHMHGINEFMATYPDARMIWSHRDPLVCIPSIAGLTLSFIRTHNPKVDPIVAGEYFNQHWLAAIKKMMAYDDSRADKGWCHHLYYHDLVQDPAAAIGAAYQHFEEPFDPLHARKIKAWVDQRPKNILGVHKYSLEEFGLDARKLREQYAEYMERYNVPVEYKN